MAETNNTKSNIVTRTLLFLYNYIKSLIIVILFFLVATPVLIARIVETLCKKVKYLDKVSHIIMNTVMFAGFTAYPVIITLLIVL